MIDQFTGDLRALQDANKRIDQLQDSVRELCNLVLIFWDNSKDEALRAQAQRVVKRAWERLNL